MFFSPEILKHYGEGIADGSKSETVDDLRARRFRTVRLEGERALFEAAWARVDCLVWNPGPGDAVRQVYRIPE